MSSLSGQLLIDDRIVLERGAPGAHVLLADVAMNQSHGESNGAFFWCLRWVAVTDKWG